VRGAGDVDAGDGHSGCGESADKAKAELVGSEIPQENSLKRSIAVF
jgi:hypothetical protein